MFDPLSSPPTIQKSLKLSNPNTRISDLRGELATYKLRYPIGDQLTGVNRLEASVARRASQQTEVRHEIDILNSRFRNLEDEPRRLDQGIGGFERALEALTQDTLDRHPV